MEIEKTLTVSASREQVWDLLLDPKIMGGAVPGMKSIDVISPTEYVAEMHQKISFINAKFKLRTHIVEQRAPEYLRAEGTGEDASVASSLKQRSEVFLESTQNGETELRIKANVDVLGRLGTFGLAVMKTKADRMWEEFGTNLKARIEAGVVPSGVPAPVEAPARASRPVDVLPSGTDTSSTAAAGPRANGTTLSEPASESAAARAPLTTGAPPFSPQHEPPPPARAVHVTTAEAAREGSFWSRLLRNGRAARSGGEAVAAGRAIRVEVRELDRTISVEWPVEAADACRDWLKDLLGRSESARPTA